MRRFSDGLCSDGIGAKRAALAEYVNRIAADPNVEQALVWLGMKLAVVKKRIRDGTSYRGFAPRRKVCALGRTILPRSKNVKAETNHSRIRPQSCMQMGDLEWLGETALAWSVYGNQLTMARKGGHGRQAVSFSRCSQSHE